jgi:SelR domain
MKTYNKSLEAVSPLTLEQCRITQQDTKERPFRNEYWDNKQPGLYVDVVSASHYSGPPTNSTAISVVGRDRSPACALLHRFRGRNVDNLFVVGASVDPFNAGYNPIGL